jgi:hypothetical protein
MNKRVKSIIARSLLASFCMVILALSTFGLMRPSAVAQTEPYKRTVAASGMSVAYVNGELKDTQNYYFTGYSFQRATVLNLYSLGLQNTYATVPNTQWISVNSGGGNSGTFENKIIQYRANFTIPLDINSPIKSFKVRLYADNAANVYVNGHLLGMQNDCNCFENFGSPEDVFIATGTQLTNLGLTQTFNTLDIYVHNYSQYTGLDYKAVIEY